MIVSSPFDYLMWGGLNGDDPVPDPDYEEDGGPGIDWSVLDYGDTDEDDVDVTDGYPID